MRDSKAPPWAGKHPRPSTLPRARCVRPSEHRRIARLISEIEYPGGPNSGAVGRTSYRQGRLVQAR